MKDFTPRRVFILENGKYQEISLAEHCIRKEVDEEYNERKFISLQGMIMEVSESDYIDFYREKRRQKYVAEAAAQRGDVSYDALTSDEFNGENIIVSPNCDLDEIVEKRITMDKLRQGMSMLTQEECRLIIAHFYDGKSQTEISKNLGISQQAVSKRISKICTTLKNFIKN